MLSDTKVEHATPMFVALGIFYVSMMLLSNIIVGKLISVGHITLTAGILIYPLVWIVSDIKTEIYGMKLSMLINRMAVVMSLVMVLVFTITLLMPYPPFWQGQSAFTTVMKQIPRIVASSLIAYYIGQWLNDMVVSWMKVKTRGRGFGWRAILSTVVGQIGDTGLFFVLAFVGTMPRGALVSMIIVQYIGKVGYEVVALPLTTKIVKWWKKREGLDTFDKLGWETYRPL